jgi:hypothetical protein
MIFEKQESQLAKLENDERPHRKAMFSDARVDSPDPMKDVKDSRIVR